MDAFWIAFYEFPEKFLNVEYNSYDSTRLKIWSTLGKSCSWFWCYENYCFVSDRPKNIHFDHEWRMHNENGAAIEWMDGWSIYYWKGVEVPKKLIETPELITKEDLKENTNAEVRRCFIEKLGVSRYFEILSEGQDLKVIDEDIDNQGYPMKLMSFDFESEIIQVLECTCPSTERVYNIYPPSQNCKNVWDAKADTFNKEKLAYRHGDVGLVSMDKDFESPLIET